MLIYFHLLQVTLLLLGVGEALILMEFFLMQNTRLGDAGGYWAW